MARLRSNDPARRGGSPLAISVLAPLAVLAAVLAIAAALVATSAGHRAADKQLDARAVTVKKAWDAAGQPAGKADLRRLGKRLNARLAVVHGSTAAPGKTSGGVRSYAFRSRGQRSLNVALPVKDSSDALSSGLTGAIVVGLVGVLLLALIGSALLRLAAGGPLRGFAGAVQRFQSGDHSARAPVKGAREVRAAAGAFNSVVDHT